MKAFVAGVALVLALGLLTGVLYDWASVSSAEGYFGRSSVHVTDTGHPVER